MGTIYLVRHGQAAFGTDDYDRLTDLGHQQARLLGNYFKQNGLSFDYVVAGTLKRHEQTAAGILEGLGQAADIHRFAGLNEYDPDALLEAYLGKPFETPHNAKDRDPELVKAHFRLLRSAMNAWVNEEISPQGMPTFINFQQGILDVIKHCHESYAQSKVLIASSGGPISAAIAGLLNAPHTTAIDLNLRIRNTGVSEIAINGRMPQVIAMNNVGHLLPEHPHFITYA